MINFKTLKATSILTTAAALIGCSSGGLPSDLNQTSSQPAPVIQQDVHLPVQLKLDSGVTQLTQNQTATAVASQGYTPYRYSTDSGTIDANTGAFVATTVGTSHITVTDAQNITATVTITVVANTPPPDTTVTQPPVWKVANPPPTINTPPPPPATVQISRWFNNIHGLHQIVPASGLGWQSDGPVYNLYVSGGAGYTPLYICQTSTAYFETNRSDCEGFSMISTAGYMASTQQPGTVPLVRMVRSNYYIYGFNMLLTDHLDLKQNSTDPATWSVPAEFVPEGILGFVPQ